MSPEIAAIFGGSPHGPPPAGQSAEPPGTRTDHRLRVRLYLTGEAAPLVGPIGARLTARNARLTALALGEPSLEDVFIRMTGRELR